MIDVGDGRCCGDRQWIVACLTVVVSLLWKLLGGDRPRIWQLRFVTDDEICACAMEINVGSGCLVLMQAWTQQPESVSCARAVAEAVEFGS